MKGLLIPLAMALVGAGAGGGAALVLRPGAPAEQAPDEGAAEPAEGHVEKGGHGADDHAPKADGDEHAAEAGDGGPGAKPAAKGHGGGHGKDDDTYVKIVNQFVVPVIEDGRTRSLVMMTLALDVAPGARGAVFTREPKLRDALLRVMFDHANSGGFSGGFTGGERVEPLREAMRERAAAILGPDLIDVLILDLIRQEV